MSRTKGSENKDSGERKRRILNGIWKAMRAANGKPLSWREMAVAGGVGPATLAHHFGKRDDVVEAILIAKREEGIEALSTLATPSSEDVETSLRDALDHMIVGLTQFDVGDLVGIGFAEGMYHERIGPAFVTQGLEPILMNVEQRLKTHQKAGAVAHDVDIRAAAIMLVSPVLLTFTHQRPLGGAAIVPTDLTALAHQSAKSVAAFCGGLISNR
ncbi:MAG: TetR/AcrR family transcriptional regulator [Pseudomonadota bacterium]